MPNEPAGVALGATKATYFYLHTSWAGPPEHVKAQGPMCPPYLVMKLATLYAPIL